MRFSSAAYLDDGSTSDSCDSAISNDSIVGVGYALVSTCTSRRCVVIVGNE
jgi:hypothetical protein